MGLGWHFGDLVEKNIALAGKITRPIKNRQSKCFLMNALQKSLRNNFTHLEEYWKNPSFACCFSDMLTNKDCDGKRK